MSRNKIDGGTGLICLLGNPVTKSFSPQIQNIISSVMNVNLIYLNFEIEHNQLSKAIEGLRALKVKGFNVTIPYKEKIIELLDEISPEAKEIGAVNTVKMEDGKLIGYNTDWLGYYEAKLTCTGKGFEGDSVLILGAGGAAKAIAICCLKNNCANIMIYNRTIEKAEELVNNLMKNYSGRVNFCSIDILNHVISHSTLIINTTSAGNYSNVNLMPIGEEVPFKKGQIFSEIIYNPSETKLMKLAQSKGAFCFNGFEMLLQQAIKSWEIWCNKKIELDKIEEIRSLIKETWTF